MENQHKPEVWGLDWMETSPPPPPLDRLDVFSTASSLDYGAVSASPNAGTQAGRWEEDIRITALLSSRCALKRGECLVMSASSGPEHREKL